MRVGTHFYDNNIITIFSVSTEKTSAYVPKTAKNVKRRLRRDACKMPIGA